VSTSRPGALPGPVHFVGIGGAGMSAIAYVLARMDVAVSGSDLKASRYTRLVEEAGVRVEIGHRGENLGDPALVVISSAIPDSNPEVRAARQRSIPVLQRAEMLARLMAMRRGIAVAGTHGKTTTSSMIAHVLHECGRAPTFLVGGEVNDRGSNAGVGDGEWLVAEADESDGSLLHLRPEVAVVTNVELDHHTHYACVADLHDVFRRFVALLPPDGLLVLGKGGGTEFLAADAPAPVVSCGLGSGELSASLVSVSDEGSESVVHRDGREVARLVLKLPGEHNVLNALTAMAALEHCGVGYAEAVGPLATFSGAGRRYQVLGEERGVRVVDDYAHHPSELAATLRAARAGGHRRVIAVFQPHLFSRTRYLQREFGRSLTLADLAVVTDIFPAREEPQPGVTGKLVVDAFLAERPSGPVAYMPRLDDVVEYLLDRVAEGDVVLTMGAGDVHRVGEALLAGLSAGSPATVGVAAYGDVAQGVTGPDGE